MIEKHPPAVAITEPWRQGPPVVMDPQVGNSHAPARAVAWRLEILSLGLTMVKGKELAEPYIESMCTVVT